MDLRDYYTTGEIAELVGVTSSTIRTWDKKGTLKPAYTSEEGYRYYSQEQYDSVLKSQGVDIPEENSNIPKEYLLSCWGCGTLIPSNYSNPIIRVMCDDCKKEYEINKQETLKQYIILKQKVMYERALRMLEKSEKVNMAEIEEAAKIIGEYALQNVNAFESSHEMITAMILINKKIKVKMQHVISGKRLDIYLPDYNCGVEVDGFFHRGNEIKDSKRDIMIRREMGDKFEIVRIPTKYIEHNPMKIPEYIKTIYNIKQTLRKKNNGFIPDDFSKSTKMLYESL